MGDGNDIFTLSTGAKLVENGSTGLGRVAIFGGRNDEARTDTGTKDRFIIDDWSGTLDLAQINGFEFVDVSLTSSVIFTNELDPENVDPFDMTVRKGQKATFEGDVTIPGKLDNFGSVDLSGAKAIPGDVLRVEKDYEARSDLFIDADLSTGGGRDNKPATDAAAVDQLLVKGDALGSTKVHVNVTGERAPSDLNNDGIVNNNEGLLFAQVTGNANAESFVLAEPIIDGAYFTEIVYFDKSASESGLHDFVLGTFFTPGNEAYEAMPIALLNMMEPMQFEDRAWRIANGRTVDTGIQLQSWVAIGYEDNKFNPSSSESLNRLNQNIFTARFGIAGTFDAGVPGDVIIGGEFNYVDSNGRTHSDDLSSSLDSNGYGGALTASYISPSGFYVDGQARIMAFKTDIDNDTDGKIANNADAFGYGFSLEAGAPFSLAEGFSLTPKAQIAYSHIHMDSIDGGAMREFSSGNVSRWEGRFGVKGEKAWDLGEGRKGRAFAELSLVQLLDQNHDVEISGASANARLPKTRGEISVGGSFDLGQGMGSVFVKANLGEDLSSGNASTRGGEIGWSLKF